MQFIGQLRLKDNVTYTYTGYDEDKNSEGNLMSLTEYLSQNYVISDKDHKTYYICYHCAGSGRVYDPDFRDVYEGNKLRRVLNCQVCAGKGYGNFKEWHTNHYRKESQKIKKKSAEEGKLNSIRKRALKKLTKEEKKALHLYDY